MQGPTDRTDPDSVTFNPAATATMPNRSMTLRPLALATLISAMATPLWAQDVGDAARGKLLFEDTPTASGNAALTSSCVHCHGVSGFTVIEGRRLKIAGITNATAGTTSPAPAISFSTAMGRLSWGLQNIGSMRQFETGLTGQQIRDLGAYLADTPKVSHEELAFTAPAVNTLVTQSITVTAPVTETTRLKITSISLAGNNAARFSRTYTCDGAELSPAQSCAISLSFSSPQATTGSQTNPVLRIVMTQGDGTVPIVRNVLLTGQTAGASDAPGTPPTTYPPTTIGLPTPDSNGGGGAAGLWWVMGLAGMGWAIRRKR